MKLKIGDRTAPIEPELSLHLRQDGKQVVLVGQHSEIETPMSNCLCWITEEGEFVFNADAIHRVGLRFKPYFKG